MRTIVILLILSIFFAACGGRNPNLSKKQLEAIMADSVKREKEKQAEEIALPDTSYVPPAGAKYTENRSVDPAAQPVVLKVALTSEAKTAIKLSHIGKSISYTTLTLPGESDFFLAETPMHITVDRQGQSWSQSMGQSTRIRKTGNFYIAEDMLAVRVFDDKGNFIRNLVESEFEGKSSPDMIEIKVDDGFKQGIMEGIRGNQCYVAKTSKEGVFRGVYNFDTKELIMSPAKRLLGGSFIDKNTLFSFRGGYRENMALSLALNGDTLCKFTNYLPMPEKLKGKTIANSDESFFYRSGDKLFFRQAYCDTIFRVESASRLVPAFCFDFGAQRVSIEEGLGAKTGGKLLPWKLIDTKNKLILLFTEGRDCPNCREKGEVKFYGALYDKQSGASTPLNVPVNNPESMAIENDIDGGLPVLLNSLSTSGNYLIATFTKKQIIDVLKDKSLSGETVAKLKAQAEALKHNQMLVMAVEMK